MHSSVMCPTCAVVAEQHALRAPHAVQPPGGVRAWQVVLLVGRGKGWGRGWNWRSNEGVGTGGLVSSYFQDMPLPL